MRFRIRWGYSLLACALCLGAGCQRTVESESDWQQRLDAELRAPTATVLSANVGDPHESPALRTGAASDATATPEGTCRAFLDCLAREDSSGAERFLTATAVLNARQSKLDWQAPGGPGAVYTLKPPRYASNKEELAMVDCAIREQVDGQEVTSEISWMLRRGSQGWRICGMVIAWGDEGVPELLSFESLDDVQWIRAGLNEDETTAHRDAAGGTE